MAEKDQGRQAGLGRFVQRGAATLSVSFDGPPKDFYFVLLPKLTMLALASAIEPLRIANQIARQELYNWHTMTVEGQGVVCSNGLQIPVDQKLAKLNRDVMVFVCGGVDPHLALDRSVTAWVRSQRRLGSRMGGICTGTFTLAKAGLLANKRFTLHWENQASFIEEFPDLLPTSNLFECDGNLMTAAGGSAATDMMLHLIEADFGHEFATLVSDMCLHGRNQTDATQQRSSYSAVLESRNPALVAAVGLMQENIEEPLGLEEIAGLVNISRRQLERNFKSHVNLTPRRYYTDVRLARAYALFGETEMSVANIAAATGFNSASNLSKLFREKYGISPSYFRKTWAAPKPMETAPEPAKQLVS